MTLRIRIDRAAERELRRLPKALQRRVDERLSSLAEEPLPRGSVKLQGATSLRRVKVGDYRILYEFDPAAGEITVAAIVHRSIAYRGLDRFR